MKKALKANRKFFVTVGRTGIRQVSPPEWQSRIYSAAPAEGLAVSGVAPPRSAAAAPVTQLLGPHLQEGAKNMRVGEGKAGRQARQTTASRRNREQGGRRS